MTVNIHRAEQAVLRAATEWSIAYNNDDDQEGREVSSLALNLAVQVYNRVLNAPTRRPLIFCPQCGGTGGLAELYPCPLCGGTGKIWKSTTDGD